MGPSVARLWLDLEKVTTLGRRKTKPPGQPDNLEKVAETSRIELEKVQKSTGQSQS